MPRLLAVLAAIGMVAGAFVYRYGVPGGDDGGPADESDVAGQLICAAELGAAVCDAVGDEENVLVEPVAETASRLIEARGPSDAGVAGWVVFDPWPAMVDAERARTSKAALFAEADAEGLASTPLVLVTRKGQGVPGCAAELTWRCIGDAAQSPTFRLGADPTTPTRLFIRAAALSGLLGRTDWATNDLELPSAEGQPDPRSWIAAVDERFEQAAGFGARSLENFVLQQGSANAFATTGVRATGAPTASFDVTAPTPAVTIAVTYAPAARNGRDLDVGPLRDPLRDAGWQVRPNAKTEGLPSPGVLLALRST